MPRSLFSKNRHSFCTQARVPVSPDPLSLNPFFLLIFLAAVLCLCACRPRPHPATPTLTLPPISTPTPAPSPPATASPTVTLTPVPMIVFPKIDRQPRPATIEDWAPWAGRTFTTTLSYDPNSLDIWQVDYRTQNLSQLDLRNSLNNLLLAFFDDRTVWPPPNKMPVGFDPQHILELGKDPGLEVRSLHARGITGKGVGIAIIDQPLLVDHQEYRDQLRLYEELLFFPDSENQQAATMHAGAVASLAVGKTVGVAPEADLYFIAADLASGKDANGNYQYDFTKAAQAIRRILEINQQLPPERKIRVISMSFGWAAGYAGYDAISAATADARAQGVFLVSAYPAMEQIYGFKLSGMERTPLADPNLFVSYTRSHFCEVYADRFPPCQPGTLLVPMSSRTTASPMGKDEYVFYRMGGESWTMPYLAGMYALAAQVDPAITPERFWELALQTGRTVDITTSLGAYQLGTVLDPVRVIQALGK